MAPIQPTPNAPGTDELRTHLLEAYDKRIAYYWRVSQYNKRSYKTTRYLVIVLGALVTLISSMSSASFVTGWLEVVFKILTPLLAATLAVVGGVSQAFQWGATWSDQVLTATRLEKERDRIALIALALLDPVKEMALLDDLILAETQGFFQRLFGSGGITEKKPSP